MRAQEKGVLSSSNLYFHTASPRAKKLFFYPLCTGHFVCDSDYNLKRTSYDSFLVMHIVHGTGFLETDGQNIALKEGDFVLVDCYRPTTIIRRPDGNSCGSILTAPWPEAFLMN